MKSYRVSVPRYDLPIRLRPVRPLRALFHSFMPCSIPFAVVPTLHNRHHAPACFPRTHQLLPLPTAKRQVSPPHLLLRRHRRVLLHLRRRRVRIPHSIQRSTPQYALFQGCQTYLVLALCQSIIHSHHLFLLWWIRQRNRAVNVTCTSFDHFVCDIARSRSVSTSILILVT